MLLAITLNGIVILLRVRLLKWTWVWDLNGY